MQILCAVGPSPVHKLSSAGVIDLHRQAHRQRMVLAHGTIFRGLERQPLETKLKWRPPKPLQAAAESRVQAKSIAEAKARKQAQKEVELAKAEAKLHQKAIASVKAFLRRRQGRQQVPKWTQIYTSDDAKHNADIVNQADVRFVAAVKRGCNCEICWGSRGLPHQSGTRRRHAI